MQHIHLRRLYIAVAAAFMLGIMVFVTQARTDAKPADPKPGSSLDERITQRKKEQSLKLDEKIVNRLEKRCARVQSKLRELQNPRMDVLANRQRTYEAISAKTWLGLGSIKLTGEDVFNLKRHALKLDDQIEAFQNNADNHNQVIRDVLQMNCAADVKGFMSLVETARQYDQQLHNQSLKIREIINVNIREEFDALAKKV